MSKHVSRQLLQQIQISDTAFPPPANLVNYIRAVQMSPYFAVKNVDTSTVLPVRPIGTKTKLVKNSNLHFNDGTPKMNNRSKKSRKHRSRAPSAVYPFKRTMDATT
jgi:hypothetical protein